MICQTAQQQNLSVTAESIIQVQQQEWLPDSKGFINYISIIEKWFLNTINLEHILEM